MQLIVSISAPEKRVSPRPTRGQLEIACKTISAAFKQKEDFAHAIFYFAMTSIMTVRAVMAFSMFIVRIQKVLALVGGASKRSAERHLDDYLAELDSAKEDDETEASEDEAKKAYLLLSDLPTGKKTNLNKEQQELLLQPLRDALLSNIPPKSALHEEARKALLGNRGLNQSFALWFLEKTAASEQEWSDFREALDALAGGPPASKDDNTDDEDGEDEGDSAEGNAA